MARKSSPGAYSRLSASSMPEPVFLLRRSARVFPSTVRRATIESDSSRRRKCSSKSASSRAAGRVSALAPSNGHISATSWA